MRLARTQRTDWAGIVLGGYFLIADRDLWVGVNESSRCVCAASVHRQPTYPINAAICCVGLSSADDGTTRASLASRTVNRHHCRRHPVRSAAIKPAVAETARANGGTMEGGEEPVGRAKFTMKLPPAQAGERALPKADACFLSRRRPYPYPPLRRRSASLLSTSELRRLSWLSRRSGSCHGR